MTYSLIRRFSMKTFSALALPALSGIAFLFAYNTAASAQAAPKFGVYDPYGNFASDSSVRIEHIFISWDDIDLSSLQAADTYARARGRELLITVEPWSWDNESKVSSSQLRRGIFGGKYNATMAAICTAAGKLQSKPTIRWGHEMDNPNDHFPWAMWRPADYIKAYRSMVDICRKVAPDLKYMWSPAGLKNARAYYPGASYVDTIGLSVFGLQRQDIDNFGRSRTFSEVLAPAYARVGNLGKPVVIAELGYAGDADYVARWNRDARAAHPQFPAIVATVYFNHEEVHPWRKYGLPDWRVTGHVLR